MIVKRSAQIDFRVLQYFLGVAEAGSFSRAGELLRVAQPALSRQIRKLEEELNVQLFVRTKVGVELTEAGLMLVPKAQSMLRQISQIAADLRARSSSVKGTVTLGMPPATGELLVSSLVRRCAKDYPDLELKIVEGFSGFLFERLLNEELSLLLMHNPVVTRSISIEPLLTEPMYLVGPGKPMCGVDPVTSDMKLMDVPLILPGSMDSLRLHLENKFGRDGRHLNVKFEVQGLVMIKSMVATGLGYTVCTYAAIHRELSEKRLSAVKLGPPDINSTLCIAYRTEQETMRPVAIVRDLIRSEVHRMVDEKIWRGDPSFAARYDPSNL